MKTDRIIWILILVIGIGGRLWGAWVNNDSNDDHAEVVVRLLNNQSIDHKDSCWECFQPPAFYTLHASLTTLTGAKSKWGIRRQMHEVNALFSIFLIGFFYWSLRKVFPRRKNLIKFATIFSLFSPSLFSMSIQGTNDMVVIFLSGLAFCFLMLFLTNKNPMNLYLMGISASLAPIFKGSGLAVFAMFSFWLIILAIRHKQYISMIIPFFGIVYLVFFSHYHNNYDLYGNAFEINIEKPAPPKIFEDEYDFGRRPGIVSVKTSYFNFKFLNLLEYPYTINEGNGFYPKHRTSFWATMYGSFFDIQFLQHPYTWKSMQNDRLNMVRVIFILGLFSILVLAVGSWNILMSVTRWKKWTSNDWLFFIALSIFYGTMVFALKYSYDYRDFGCIKSIFIMPAFIPLLLICYRGWLALIRPSWNRIAITYLWILAVLFATDITFLLVKLSKIAYATIAIL